MRRFLSSLLGTLFVLVGLYGRAQPVRAAAGGLTFAPGYLVVDIPAGQTFADASIAAKNDTIAPVTLSAAPTDVDTSSTNLLSLTTSKSEATRAIKVKDPLVTLLPGQSVNFLIHVDTAGLKPGGQYTSVLIKQVTPATTKAVPLHQAASIGVFLIKESGAMRSLQLTRPLPHGIVFKMPSQFAIKLTASGNVEVTPRAVLQITGEGGRVQAKATINDRSERLSPGASGTYNVPLHYDGSVSPGKHNISVAYRYDGLDTPIIARASFFYVPLWYIAVLLAGLSMLAVLLRAHYKKPKNP